MFQAWDRTTRSYSLHSRSRGSYQEIRQGNSIASEPSSSNPHLSFVGISRRADEELDPIAIGARPRRQGTPPNQEP
jgi:hypothetical protein